MNGMEKEIIEVSLDDIIPNRFQPRLTFDEDSLNELAKSIRLHGIIQPLVLRKVGNKYEIIAGERRFKAAYVAGLTKVPAIIISLNDNESAEVAIVENLQRRDLSPIEEAKSYQKLLDRGYLTQDQLASRMGKTQATISNKMRLLNLDPQVQNALLNNQISERHARSLLKLQNKEDQVSMLNEIINRKLNVRDTDEEINRKLNPSVNINEVSETNIIQPEPLPEIQPELQSEIPVVDMSFDNKDDDIVFKPVDMSNEIPKVEIHDNNIDKSLYDFDQIIPSINTNIPEEEVENVKPYKRPVLGGKSENPIPYIRPVLEDDLPEITPIDNQIDVRPTQLDDTVLPFTSKINKSMEQVQDKINDLVKEINSMGFEAKMEEYDFQSEYQFVIKVDRNN